MNAQSPGTNILRHLWEVAIAAVHPKNVVPAFFASHPEWLRLAERANRMIVVGAGKAGSGMALALEQVFEAQLHKLEGWVNVPADTLAVTRKIHLHPARPAGYNLPTLAGAAGSQVILQQVKNARSDDLVIVLISGGGSALLPLPVDGVTLADKLTVTRQLQQHGADIHEVNCVRKQLSQIKGGRLARACRTKMLTLIISDVEGDQLDVIASGPTVPDSSTFADALAVIGKYQLINSIPASVLQYLTDGTMGKVGETPKLASERPETFLLATNSTCTMAAHQAARSLGILTSTPIIGPHATDTFTVAREHLASLRHQYLPPKAITPPIILISGGETTVALGANPGKGGRNQEMALAIANELVDHEAKALTILCAGTDGEDGPTDAAGALLNPTWLNQYCHSPALADALSRHDAYPFLRATGGLFITGPTGTNVMDIRMISMASATT